MGGHRGCHYRWEEVVAQRQAEVENAAQAGHAALTDACRALTESQRTVERALGALAGTGGQAQLLTSPSENGWRESSQPCAKR
jgi:hypothetical protein